MSITRRISIASAFAAALLVGGAVPAGGVSTSKIVAATPVQLSAVSDVTSAIPGAQYVSLTRAEMSDIHGDGFWSKIKSFFKKVTKWIWNHLEQVAFIVAIVQGIIEIIQAVNGDDHDTTVQEQNDVTANEYYASEGDLNAGNMYGSDQSETGYYVASVEYDPCSQNCEPIMY